MLASTPTAYTTQPPDLHEPRYIMDLLIFLLRHISRNTEFCWCDPLIEFGQSLFFSLACRKRWTWVGRAKDLSLIKVSHDLDKGRFHELLTTTSYHPLSSVAHSCVREG